MFVKYVGPQPVFAMYVQASDGEKYIEAPVGESIEVSEEVAVALLTRDDFSVAAKPAVEDPEIAAEIEAREPRKAKK